MLTLGKYSMGIGDKFGKQSRAQLLAFEMASFAGVEITPVWNKSAREHQITGTTPLMTREAAEKAVSTIKWDKPYFLNAEGFSSANIHNFIDDCNFFTIDASLFASNTITEKELNDFISNFAQFLDQIKVPGQKESFAITNAQIKSFAKKYLPILNEISTINQILTEKKGNGNYLLEISFAAEKELPTNDIFYLLASLAFKKIPVQVFSTSLPGLFCNGVDFMGEVKTTLDAIEANILAINLAKRIFTLPEDLKLGLHNASDKFSLYPGIGNLMRKYNVGIHLRTSGTSWLEECIGLAKANEDALDLVKTIYSLTLHRIEKLSKPYGKHLSINQLKLPSTLEMVGWNSEAMSSVLTHDGNEYYNPDMRQLMHISYEVAAEYGDIFQEALTENAEIIGQQVTKNLYERHIKRLFFDEK
jgi:hypothetical protein